MSSLAASAAAVRPCLCTLEASPEPDPHGRMLLWLSVYCSSQSLEEVEVLSVSHVQKHSLYVCQLQVTSLFIGTEMQVRKRTIIV